MNRVSFRSARQRRQRRRDPAIVVDGAGGVGHDALVGVGQEARHAGVAHAPQGDDRRQPDGTPTRAAPAPSSAGASPMDASATLPACRR